MLRFYSQNGEDYILWKALGTDKGVFVDVGAFDGVYLSNSLFFELNGWKGVCVEGHPHNFELCKNNRPNSICLHAACVGDEEEGEVEFFAEDIGLYSGVLGGDEEQLADVAKRYEKNELDFSGFNKVKVQSKSLNSIFKDNSIGPNEADFVSIDTEGSEHEILEDFDIQYYQPKILVIEANDDEQKEKIVSLMANNNYGLGKQLGVNLFFASNGSEYLERLEAVKVNCVLEAMQHPRGKEYTIENYNTESVLMREVPSDVFARLRKYMDSMNVLTKEAEFIYDAYVLAKSSEHERNRFAARNEQIDASNKRLREEIDRLGKEIEKIRSSLLGKILFWLVSRR